MLVNIRSLSKNDKHQSMKRKSL